MLGLTVAACGPLLPRIAKANATANARANARANAAPLSLLVAGPAGDQTSRWGDACALALSSCYAGSPAIVTQTDGGLDGVTGANQLDALVIPDGRTAAILPGAALIAWLTGDDRVHFDPTHWVPVMAATNSGVLVVRLGGKPATLEGLRSISPLRLAVDQPQSNDLAALVALTRMGVKITPLFGLRDIAAKTQAFVNGAADAVFVAGEGVPEDIAPLAANGGVPVFCLGAATASGTAGPDPLFPGLPDALAFSGDASTALDGAYHAAAAAARLDFLVVLPKLCDPDAVAQWRTAAAGAMTSPALAAAASASWVTLQPAMVAAAQLAALNLGPSDQAGLQAFLSTSFGWQPG